MASLIGGLFILASGVAFAVLLLLAFRGAVLWFWRVTDILIEFQGLRERIDRTNALLEAGIRVWPQQPRPPAAPPVAPPTKA